MPSANELNSAIEAYCGIDVACAKGKSLPVALLVRDGNRLRALQLRGQGPRPPRGMGNLLALDPSIRNQFAQDALHYLYELEAYHGVRIVEIAIDAPRAPAVEGRRKAECAMDALGISCIATPSEEAFKHAREKALSHVARGGAIARLPHANQIWMLVGFELFRVLERWRPCIEVFPQATMRALAPDVPHKSTADGLAKQTVAFAAAAGWDSRELTGCAYGAAHDRLDALLSAWIASLPPSRLIAHGDGAADTIWTAAYPNAASPSGAK